MLRWLLRSAVEAAGVGHHEGATAAAAAVTAAAAAAGGGGEYTNQSLLRTLSIHIFLIFHLYLLLLPSLHPYSNHRCQAQSMHLAVGIWYLTSTILQYLPGYEH